MRCVVDRLRPVRCGASHIPNAGEARGCANKKQKAIMLIVLDNLQQKAWCVGVENVAQFSTSFIHGGRRKAGVELTRTQTVIPLIFLDKLHTGKEK